MVTWNENLTQIRKLESLMREHSKKSLKRWKVKNSYQNTSFTLLEKIRTNLITCNSLIEFSTRQPIMVLSLGLILRTIITDVIMYKYFRQIKKIAGLKGFVMEMNVLEIEYVKSIRKIFNSLNRNNPKTESQLNAFYQNNFEDFLTNGRVKSPKDFRNGDKIINKKIESYRNKNGIPKDVQTEKESGKLAFITDVNKNDMAIVYSYFALFHHYTSRSHIFYKDKDFRSKNPDFCLLVIYLCIEVAHNIYKEITPKSSVISKLKKLAIETHSIVKASDI